ncbi:unnamed protein product [Symbiodinium sp. CCMP2592]|nr:unnamed protein product [Symbiodinium sp. CCMP2592]
MKLAETGATDAASDISLRSAMSSLAVFVQNTDANMQSSNPELSGTDVLHQLCPQKVTGSLELFKEALAKNKQDQMTGDRAKMLLDASIEVVIHLLAEFSKNDSVLIAMQYEYGTSLFPTRSEDQEIFWKTATTFYNKFIKTQGKDKARVMLLICREARKEHPVVQAAVQQNSLMDMKGLVTQANIAEYMSSYLNLPDADSNLIPTPLRTFVSQVTLGNPLYIRETIDQLREHHIQVNEGAGGQVKNVECKDIDKVNVSQWGHTAMIGNTVCALEALDPLEAAVLKMSTCFVGPFTLGDLAASICSRWADSTHFDFLRLFQAIRKLQDQKMIEAVDVPEETETRRGPLVFVWCIRCCPEQDDAGELRSDCKDHEQPMQNVLWQPERDQAFSQLTTGASCSQGMNFVRAETLVQEITGDGKVRDIVTQVKKSEAEKEAERKETVLRNLPEFKRDGQSAAEQIANNKEDEKDQDKEDKYNVHTIDEAEFEHYQLIEDAEREKKRKKDFEDAEAVALFETERKRFKEDTRDTRRSPVLSSPLFMKRAGTYYPLAPLFLVGVLLIYVGLPTSTSVQVGQEGLSSSSDFALLLRHHGSMPPKPQTDKNKVPSKGGQKGDNVQVSRIDFGLPAAVSTSLQSIATRSTQDLWGATAFTTEDATAEQLAQRRANAISKLSKRLSGNVRAKEELGGALFQWCSIIGQHLLGLVGRARAICTKIDEDTLQAVQDMNEALVHQPSAASLEKVTQATSSVGKVWSELQELEVQRIAAALRAFAAVGSPGASPEVSLIDRQSEASFGAWGNTSMAQEKRHWCGEAFQESQADNRPSEPELIPDESPVEVTWRIAWLALLRFAVEQGQDPVGELSASAEQDEWLYPSQLVEMGWVLHSGCTACCRGFSWFTALAFYFPGAIGVCLAYVLAYVAVFSTGSVPATTNVAELAPARFAGAPSIRFSMSMTVFTMPCCSVRFVKFSAYTPLLGIGGMWLKLFRPCHLSSMFCHQLACPGTASCFLSTYVLLEVLSRLSKQPVTSLVGKLLPMLPPSNSCSCVTRMSSAEHVVPGLFPMPLLGFFLVGLSLEDVFSTSLSLPSPAELAFHEESGANAVVMFPNGLHFTFAPAFADHLSIRSTVMGRFMADVTSGAQDFSHFARVLPPLDRLPAVQFVAMLCTEGQFPGIIDFRPIGGGITVAAMFRNAHPASRLKDVIESQGEPDPSRSVMEALARGCLSVLHRECIVDPYSPLQAAVPAPLVIVRRREQATLSENEPSSPATRHSAMWALIGVTLFRVHGSRLILGGILLHLSLAAFLPPEDPAQVHDIPIQQEATNASLFCPGDNLVGMLAVPSDRHDASQWLRANVYVFVTSHDKGLQRVQDVMRIGGLTTWDLPGVELHGQSVIWKWTGMTPSCAMSIVIPRLLYIPLGSELPHTLLQEGSFLLLSAYVVAAVREPSSPDHDDSPLDTFRTLLREAGHRAETNTLHVAFDTLPTQLDVVSCPAEGPAWWIVRDGMSRELLRPVAPWYEADGRRILTVNSLGQAQGLTYGAAAGALHRLATGVRAACTYPLSRIIGHLSASELVFTEVAIGSFALQLRSSGHVFLALSLLHLGLIPGHAMQQEIALRPAASQSTGWGAGQAPAPTIARVWTHALAAPTVLPFIAAPDPVVMAQCVANTARGVTAIGDFVWTTPQIVQGVAHLLHVPSGSAPPMVYWLLHYRGRGTVYGAVGAVFDWQQIGQAAAEDFGLPFFSQGQFAVWHGGRTISYGTQVPVPVHGTIITLVRQYPATASGLSAWDTPAGVSLAYHFDYDICRGPCGEVPLLGEVDSRVRPAARTSSERPVPVEPTDSGQPASIAPDRSLVRQVNEVSHQLTMLTARLESAGILQGSDTTEATSAPHFRGQEEPQDSAALGALHFASKPLFLALTVLSVAKGGYPTLGLMLCLPGVWGDGGSDSSEEPQPPSSPSLTAVTAPTPENELVGTGGADPHLIRPSDDPLARTGAPMLEWPRALPVFRQAEIPQLQTRVSAFMSEVDDRSNRLSPFLPAGCPLVIHNPFTEAEQCSVQTQLTGSGQIFRFFLQDFAQRRGWQPIVPVQPQPDESAIHLIPAAADPRLASVVLRTPQGLQPMCLPRSLPAGPSRALTLNGRFGRIREPYPTRRITDRSLQLRDGDCLLLDQGPFGPPPPTPVRSAGRLLAPGLLTLGVSSWRYLALFTVWWWFPVNSMQQLAVVPVARNRPGPEVRRFPWRSPPQDRTFQAVAGQARIRCTLLCPLTGLQGVYEVPSTSTYAEVRQHYQEVYGNWIVDVVPIWPTPRFDRLVLVPELAAGPRCVCVAARFGHTTRAFLLPGRCSFECLARGLQYLSGWTDFSLRLPPALHNQLLLDPSVEFQLRTADVLVAESDTIALDAAATHVSLVLPDRIPWDEPFTTVTAELVAVWMPDTRFPIFTSVPAGSVWLPSTGTFEGPFSARYPGRWIPVVWHPAPCVHLVRAADRRGRAHILHESRDGVFSVSFTCRTSRVELAEEFHTLPEHVWVLGATPTDTDAPLVLRDGDIVLDSYLYEEPGPEVWLIGAADRPCVAVWIPLLVLSAAFRNPKLLSILAFSQLGHATRRSRSRAASSAASSADSEASLSPRAGGWRPELPNPMHEVLSRGRAHYCILSPFHGGGRPGYFLRDTTGEDLDDRVARFCGSWSRHHILLGSATSRQPLVLIPGGLDVFATVVVHTADGRYASLVPRQFSWRELEAYCRARHPHGCHLVSSPALARFRALPSLSMGLRDGDNFRWGLADTHTHAHPPPFVRHRYVHWLPHLDGWHLSFTIKHGAWVFVWQPEGDPLFHCERHWVPAGSRWIPGSLQFCRPRSAPGTERWVPVSHYDGRCHFVQQSPAGHAHVLLHQPYSGHEPECMLLEPPCAVDSIPHGWQLAPQLRRRSGSGPLRDGDVLVPSPLPPVIPALTVLGASAAGLRSSYAGLLFATVLGLSQHADAMFAPPESQLQDPVRVGKFPWRLPDPDRALHESISEGQLCQVLSPYGVVGDPAVALASGDTVDEVRMALTGSEPIWSQDIVPVQPAPLPGHLTFVPAAPALSLACVLVVSVEWHLPILIPSRADLTWLLGYLRNLSPGPILSVRAPVNAQAAGASSNEAIRWRDGDLILAFSTDAAHSAIDIPVFREEAQAAARVRHMALWSYDFQVDFVLSVVLWRPGHRPVQAHVHRGEHWSAEARTFTGTFHVRYPGKWTPVAWAYDDQPHLCLQTGDSDLRNIIIETLTGDQLRGTCHTVHAMANAATCGILIDRVDDPCFLLGVSSDKGWAELRHGDIVHFPPTDGSHSAHLFSRAGLLVSLLFASRPSLLLAGICFLSVPQWMGAAAVPVDMPADRPAPSCLWCPFQGRCGVSPFPIGTSLVSGNTVHSSEVAPVLPAPLFTGEHSVLRLGIAQWATILMVGPPAPRALILPSRLLYEFLMQVARQHYGPVSCLAGNHPLLGQSGSHITLHDGDCLRVVQERWQPSLSLAFGRTHLTFREASKHGFWSCPLEIIRGGWILLWRGPGELFRILKAVPGQTWYPPLGSFLPAMLHETEGWWPWGLPFEDEHVVHMLPRDRALLQSSTWEASIAADSGLQTFNVPVNSRGSRIVPSTPGLGLLFLIGSGLSASPGYARRIGTLLALVCTVCYLAAWGAPPTWHRQNDDTWHLDVQDVCNLQAHLHQGWWAEGLADELPSGLPPAYHLAWQLEPSWPGGPPDSLLIATDGSGLDGGSWAFLAWGFARGRWYRLGWAAGSLHATPWLPSVDCHSGGLATSYFAELAALQSAGHWCAAMLDLWQLRMRSRPCSVSVVVDNSSAMQAAAGTGAANGPAPQRARAVWQAVQARISTHFRHVHSHVGIKVNTLVDALASAASKGLLDDWMRSGPFQSCKGHPADLYQSLWLVPRASMHQGRPVVIMRTGASAWIPPPEALPEQKAPPAARRPQDLHLLTANIQSIKDTRCNPFNPAGHGARRQYLLDQLTRLGAHVVCLQETRAPAGRWSTGGWLSWRSGGLKGQYGCEVWVRQDQVRPLLQLADFRILAAAPRFLIVSCTDPRLPLTICSAHAPHAERPAHESTAFWQELRNALQQSPKGRGLVVGIDANGDFCAQDEGGCLIGTHIARHEATSNDEHLFEFVTSLGLEAPATWEGVQVGKGWSWEHTGGKRKRLDHLLFGVGPWTHGSASQAWDFDIVNSQRDHLPLRVLSTLQPAVPAGRKTVTRHSTADAVRRDGTALWQRVTTLSAAAHGSGQRVDQLVREHGSWVRGLAPRAPLSPRQPYIQARTLVWLHQLRDWRSQTRAIQATVRQAARRLVLRRWGRLRKLDRANAYVQYRHSRLLYEAMRLQEGRLQALAHLNARKDKQAHFLSLTAAAADRWHAEGRPYMKPSLLSGGLLGAQPNDGKSLLRAPAPPCFVAAPSLLEAEAACRRQKSNKAPGPDGILNEFWNGFPVEAGRWSWEVFTRIALTGREPLHFKIAIYCALYKKGPAALPQNYRAIALLNGVAKLWHGHLRRTIGHSILRGYDSAQLGGRPGIPVGFAIAAFRAVTDLCVAAQHCTAALFIDVQAAYYEVSRSLIFSGDNLEEQHAARIASEPHLARLSAALRQHGSDHVFLASKGSRPGDGLADILFGALFAVALRHIRRACSAEGISLQAAGSYIGVTESVLPIGWADDLAILADFLSPAQLRDQLPRFVMVDIRGPSAKQVRGELLAAPALLHLPTGHQVRLSPEYRYLGVICTPRDTGRRDTELCAQRAHAAWSHAKSLLACPTLHWRLKQAWVAGRVLPAAYATIGTSIATSARALSPITGFFDRAARQLVASWRYGHLLTKPALTLLLGLSAPDDAYCIARVRLAVQLLTRAEQNATTEAADLRKQDLQDDRANLQQSHSVAIERLSTRLSEVTNEHKQTVADFQRAWPFLGRHCAQNLKP